MTDNEKNSPVTIAGLDNCGKTAFICSLIKLGHRSDISLAALKPFDTGIIHRNANEEISDGALLCSNMTGDPMEVLVSPYVAYETYPIEMAFRRDGIRINWGFLNERLKILGDLYDFTFLETPGSLCMPITEEKLVSDWLTETQYPVIWIMKPDQDQFTQNLAEISLLKGLNLNVELVINNTDPIQDQDLLFYMWEKVEQLAGQEIAGMVPFVRNLETDFSRMADKMETALPDLVSRLLGKQNP